MTEKQQIFSSKVKYDGIFSFSSFYKFCYDHLTEEFGFYIAELKYAEKIMGDAKEIKIEWEGDKKITDYFKYIILLYLKFHNSHHQEDLPLRLLVE